MRVGEWSDNTATALALADSLLRDPGLDPNDLIVRFVLRRTVDHCSYTGVCFDIGVTTHPRQPPQTSPSDAHSPLNPTRCRICLP
jgi:ADP-ribosylglycohydrolase